MDNNRKIVITWQSKGWNSNWLSFAALKHRNVDFHFHFVFLENKNDQSLVFGGYIYTGRIFAVVVVVVWHWLRLRTNIVNADININMNINMNMRMSNAIVNANKNKRASQNVCDFVYIRFWVESPFVRSRVYETTATLTLCVESRRTRGSST